MTVRTYGCVNAIVDPKPDTDLSGSDLITFLYAILPIKVDKLVLDHILVVFLEKTLKLMLQLLSVHFT